MNLLGKVVRTDNAEVLTTRESAPKEMHVAVDGNGFLQQSPETSGFDIAENVFKVASYVWDTDSLTWVRATQASGGAGGGTSVPATKSKLFDQASPTTLYVGEADPGSASSSAAWKIKRVTFNGAGFPMSITYASTGSSACVWDNRVALNYS
jgi:hypothetical protein